jgi:hypothetical protein
MAVPEARFAGSANFLGSGSMRAEHQQLTMIPVHFA